MRTLSAALLAELGATVTRPGYLIDIAFSVPLRLSTIGDVIFDGASYVAADATVSGVAWDAGGGQRGRLVLGNADLAIGTLVLDEGIADRGIVITAVYAGALAVADAVVVFDGVGDTASIDPGSGKVSIELAQQGRRTTYCPRRTISAATGFRHLQPAGTRIAFGGEIYTLERR